MSIKSDRWIIEQASRGMISPFVDHQMRYVACQSCGCTDEPFEHLERGSLCSLCGADHPKMKAISYGVSSYGYDVRAADEWKIFTNINTTVVDPKFFDSQAFVDVSGQGKVIIPPNSFALGRTCEYFKIPKRTTVICLGKSTYARIGLIVNVTPLECEWEGHVTLEFSNTTPLPAIVYANEGVAQLLFLESDEDCKTSYADRKGKYQGQTGITLPSA